MKGHTESGRASVRDRLSGPVPPGGADTGRQDACRPAVSCHAGGVAPLRTVLLDFYGTLVDLSDPVRSRGLDDFARRLGLPLGPGELYRRYVEMISGESAEGGAAGFVPYRASWLSAGRRLLAPFGRESAAGQFAGAYAEMHATAVIFSEVPAAVRALGPPLPDGSGRQRRSRLPDAMPGPQRLALRPPGGFRNRRLLQAGTPDLPASVRRPVSAASEAVMVGDTPETDVRGAHRAGLRAVWLNRDHRDWPGNLVRPDAVIGELGQLLRCLRQLDPWRPMPPETGRARRGDQDADTRCHPTRRARSRRAHGRHRLARRRATSCRNGSDYLADERPHLHKALPPKPSHRRSAVWRWLRSDGKGQALPLS
jgi:phosphoglycolate phosphatase-like HAD superfamily hydrolase